MPANKTKIVMGEGLDPYRNLAMEELLLEEVQNDSVTLYLWQNQRTVVIGRNQNAYRECHIEALENDGGHLARRMSGGGAVYHDLGNLNFTFLVPNADYDLHRQLNVILKAAGVLGIEAEFSGRNDVLANGRKFSGNAFYHGKYASFHHGTILVDVDMSVMQKYLNVPAQKMESKGVDSVRSRVINLRELVPHLTVDDVARAMRHAFVAEYGGAGTPIHTANLIDSNRFGSLYEKYSGEAWRLGKNPRLDIWLETRFPWGGVELGFAVAGNMVREAEIYSDAMDADLIERMARCLIDIEYDRSKLADALADLNGTEGSSLVSEVAEWIRKS